jgi:hypothetical protein
MSKHLWLTSIAAVVCTGSAFGFTFDGSNWIKNGDFEATATGNTNNSLNPAFGWEVGGWRNNGCSNSTAEVRSYSTIWDFADPSTTLNGWGYMGPELNKRGNNLLIGGGPTTGNSGQWYALGLRQDFWIYGNNEAISKIDAGNLEFNLSGWLGGITAGEWAGSQCGAEVVIKFNRPNQSSIEYKLPRVDTPNSVGDNSGYWSGMKQESVNGIIPVGTRDIEVFIFMLHSYTGWDGAGNHTDPNYNYAVADNIVLSVGKPVPEPATLIVLGLGALGVMARRRRRNS